VRRLPGGKAEESVGGGRLVLEERTLYEPFRIDGTDSGSDDRQEIRAKNRERTIQ
jgi:hypothetical protein